METKLTIKLFFIAFFIIYHGNILKAQKPSSMVDVKEINIEGFKYGDPISKCKEIFGKPKQYKTVDQSGGLAPEGIDKLYYIDYESLKVTYYEFQNKIYLDNINIKSDKYILNVDDVNISIGDSVVVLKKSFIKSYETYREQYGESNKEDIEHFYIDIRIPHPQYTDYGLVNVFLKEGIITQIVLGFGGDT